MQIAKGYNRIRPCPVQPRPSFLLAGPKKDFLRDHTDAFLFAYGCLRVLTVFVVVFQVSVMA